MFINLVICLKLQRKWKANNYCENGSYQTTRQPSALTICTAHADDTEMHTWQPLSMWSWPENSLHIVWFWWFIPSCCQVCNWGIHAVPPVRLWWLVVVWLSYSLTKHWWLKSESVLSLLSGNCQGISLHLFLATTLHSEFVLHWESFGTVIYYGFMHVLGTVKHAFRVGCCPANEAKGKYSHFLTKVFTLLLHASILKSMVKPLPEFRIPAIPRTRHDIFHNRAMTGTLSVKQDAFCTTSMNK